MTVPDASDPGAFGGRIYYMIDALRDQCERFDYIGPLSKARCVMTLATKACIYKWLLRKGYDTNRDAVFIRDCARQLSAKLAESDADVVFSPMSVGSQPVAYLDCRQPIVIWTDTTFAGALDFYPELKTSALCAETLRDGIANERAALNRCALAIYSSDWAARAAIEKYSLDPAKVKVVPFGANHKSDPDVKTMCSIVHSRSRKTCKLLFVGVDWDRKGGDKAFEVTQCLREEGLEAELWVVGCKPAIAEPQPEFVRWWDYISRSTKEGAKKLDSLFQECHFLILPTKADCTPFVVPEANCFAVPCLTTDVGGLSTIVRDGINGRTFAADAPARDYCKYICEVFRSTSRYTDLALTAFEEYRSRQNWTVAASNVVKLVEAIR